jgi:hypothetical protein
MLPTIGATDVFARPLDPEELHTAHRIRHPTKQEWFVSECPFQYGYIHTFPRKCVTAFDQFI